MSRKSKGECTCKIVAQNERGMLGQVRDSVYRGVKYCGDGRQVEKMFRFPRKLSEEKWLEWPGRTASNEALDLQARPCA